MQREIVTLGSYAGAPIEWYVLERRREKQLLLSRFVLDAKVFLEDCIYTSWARSSVRKWLNSAFLDAAFTTQQQSRILLTQVQTAPSPGLRSFGEETAEDRVFLLSSQEVGRYLPRPEDRLAPAEPHAKMYSRDLLDFTRLLPFYPGVQGCWWWLRDPGAEPNQMHMVWSDGTVCWDGHYVNFERGIRPALWITT